MEEPLDAKLSSRIRQVFDDFEDPGADAGWQQLRGKYPENKSRPLILWISSAAAILIMAAGLWFLDQPEQTIALKPSKPKKEVGNEGTQVDTTPPIRDNSKILNGVIALNKPAVTADSPARDIKRHVPVRSGSPVHEGTQTLAARANKKEIFADKLPLKESTAVIAPLIETIAAFKEKDPFATSDIAKTEITEPVESKDQVIKLKGIPELLKSSESSVLASIIAKNQTTSANITVTESTALPEPPKESPLELKQKDIYAAAAVPEFKKPTSSEAANPLSRAEEHKFKKAETRRKKLALSVFAGSFYNYSEGSENQLNFGAGFSSDIRLGRSLKLSTGVSIASNSLYFSDSKTHNLPQSASASLSTSDKSYNDASILTTITGYKASLLALDIPVNLKYQLTPESDKIYLSAGFSSGTYLNEIYDYRYRRFNMMQGSYVSLTEGQKITTQLNDFDLARTLNFSAGYSTAFGKKQSISIEPFVKYPLGGLGSQDLKFGATGINLKLRFAPLNK